MVRVDRKQDAKISEQLPVLPLRNMVLFPDVPTQLLVGRAGSLQLIQDAWEGERHIAIAVQKEGEEESPGPEDLYEVGVVATIHRVYKLPDNHLQILVRGLQRVQLVEYTQTSPYLIVRFERLEEVELGTREEQALAHNLSQQFQKMVSLVPTLDNELQVTVINLEKHPAQLADFIASGLDLPVAEKRELLEEARAQQRLEKLTVLLNRELWLVEFHPLYSQLLQH